MSDTIENLVKSYEKNVFNFEQPRRIGLFPIPEYPELEKPGMWTEALGVLLTTLRYLAPATLLTLFWGQQSFLFRFLKSIDNAFRAIVFSSEEQKQSVLEWIAETGPVKVEHLDTVWRHGWILCGVLDAALPGACAGHPPTRLSLKHAQAIADHYLGIEPVFTRQELESNDSLCKHQEWKLVTYLNRIRDALSKITPPVSKPASQRIPPETTYLTLDYVAKGTGLTAAQVNNRMNFKIYPTIQQSLDPGAINVLIRGPKDTYGMVVLPPILGKAQMIRQKLLGLEHKHNFTENALPITQGTGYMRTYGKNDMNKTYFIPKTKYDIDIEVDIQERYIKIGYIVPYEGKHEISITSRGQHIVGSPFTMTSSNDITSILENDNYYLEDGEEVDFVDNKCDKKVVLRVVDFVTEKMLLKENGTLEKISEDEAKRLMSIDAEMREKQSRTDINKAMAEDSKKETITFKKAANKIVQMNRVCKIIRDYNMKVKQSTSTIEKHYKKPRTHQKDIPDIVNSTFTDLNYNPFVASDKRDKVIIAENLTVSLKMEKLKSAGEEEPPVTDIYSPFNPLDSNSTDSLEKYKSLEKKIEDEILEKPLSASNPFLNDLIEHNFTLEKDLGSFVKTEYEADNSQSEETPDTPVKIIIEETDANTPSLLNTNPFFEPDPDVTHMERPKTPVLKIITGEINDDSVYVDPKVAHSIEDTLANEFINRFFLHRQENSQNESVTDFIIGAPVSLPPVLRAATPEPMMQSILITDNQENRVAFKETEKTGESASDVYLTPINKNRYKENSPHSSTFHSLDSTLSEQFNITFPSNEQQYPNPTEVDQTERDVTPRKDMWDSAYVSIDDNNMSSDSNNNDNASPCDTPNKPKFSVSDNCYMPLNLGPAERELWQSCSDLKQDIPKMIDEVKPNKCDTKRFIFTPIIEESDKSILSGNKEFQTSGIKATHSEIDSVTLAFSEIDNMYPDYATESNLLTGQKEETQKPVNGTNFKFITKNFVKSVDSASVEPDVKRHVEKTEGKISEVQTSVTESVSVSQTLHKNQCHYSQSLPSNQIFNKNETNIVKERKQYWDEKIREIEAKSEENRAQQRRRRLSSKVLRHNDSLTKRRGKQIVKNFISVAENQTVTSNPNETREILSSKSPIPQTRSEDIQTEENLVNKWKQYWDRKLETEKDEVDSTSLIRINSPKLIENSQEKRYDDITKSNVVSETGKSKTTTLPAKQELPEEMFKAFETSPKRFFGTSRKQILNKIDTFLGRQSTANEISTEISSINNNNSPDTGLVSSRISLFHNITNTEPLPWARRKYLSLHNIYQQKNSNKGNTSFDDSLILKSTDTDNKTQNNDENAIDSKGSNSSLDQTQIISSLKDKRARMVQNIHHKTFEESSDVRPKPPTDEPYHKPPVATVRSVIQKYSKPPTPKQKYTPSNLRKSSMSKSEMDIFSKTLNNYEDDLDKYKSCDELPKVNVKNFISLYESVSKPDITIKSSLGKSTSKPTLRDSKNSSEIGSCSGTVKYGFNTQKVKLSATKTRTKSESNATDMQTNLSYSTSTSINDSISTENILETLNYNTLKCSTDEIKNYVPKISSSQRNHWAERTFNSNNSLSRDSISTDTERVTPPNIEKDTTYLSLSDIEIEIVESVDRQDSSPERDIASAIDYKSRFKMAKQYFQSLEELREIKKPRKLNECEILLENKSIKSLENELPKKRVKKNIKSHSMPSSEISKIWNQLQQNQNNSENNRLMKISEKFNVEDLFTDVTEGKLSRQGSLRGIPHKKAVLETFRSMENLTDKNMSPYEIAVSQLKDITKENRIVNAQTYLREYPYLPTTDPSMYQSRVDTKASGLISLKELMSQKPRRNSVPDLRMNTKFTEKL